MTETELDLPALYLSDETAWLEAMAELIESGDHAALDFANLREYLADMARRDRREVESRLISLLLHILKWEFQPALRSRSWQASILEQRQELEGLVDRGVLRHHAEAVLADSYCKAVARAAVETGMPDETFPEDCQYTVDELLAYEPLSKS